MVTIWAPLLGLAVTLTMPIDSCLDSWTMQEAARKAWWQPGHPGWCIPWDYDSTAFMRSLTEAPNVAQPAPSPKMRISAPVPRTLQTSESLLPCCLLLQHCFPDASSCGTVLRRLLLQPCSLLPPLAALFLDASSCYTGLWCVLLQHLAALFIGVSSCSIVRQRIIFHQYLVHSVLCAWWSSKAFCSHADSAIQLKHDYCTIALMSAQCVTDDTCLADTWRT